MRGKNRAVVEAAATEANVRSRVVTFAEGTDDVGEADAEKPSKERAGQPEPVSQAPSQHNTRSIHTVTHCCLLLSCSLGIKSGACGTSCAPDENPARFAPMLLDVPALEVERGWRRFYHRAWAALLRP